jgi:hypothetical protein
MTGRGGVQLRRRANSGTKTVRTSHIFRGYNNSRRVVVLFFLRVSDTAVVSWGCPVRVMRAVDVAGMHHTVTGCVYSLIDICLRASGIKCVRLFCFTAAGRHVHYTHR